MTPQQNLYVIGMPWYSNFFAHICLPIPASAAIEETANSDRSPGIKHEPRKEANQQCFAGSSDAGRS